MTQDEIIEAAIQGHASTRDAIRWAINAALAQPEQEPVAFVPREAIRTLSSGVNHVPTELTLNDDEGKAVAVFLYPQPPQRTWVGLTDDDKVLIKHDANFNQFMTTGEYADRVQQLTEARLKDKNT